jgi:hypothetical protein
MQKIKGTYMDSYYNRLQRQKIKRNPKNDMIGGAICLIIGIILLFIRQSRIDYALTLINSDYAYYPPSTINEVYSLGNELRIFGIIFLIGGLVSFFYGVFLTQKQTKVEVVESVSKRFCPKCGREIPFDSIVCPYCQYDFK